jgi:ubiquinone/menaquinone biosynthesis C-methylase UbiE
VADTQTIKHPLFARVYERLASAAERGVAREHRRTLLEGASGRVIEIGAGSGSNFAHYPATVREVLAVEPEPYLRARAAAAAREAPVRVSVVEGHAERLPADDESFDVVVHSLMLCSVADQHAALAQSLRVLRAGGQLRFYEHVRSHTRSWAQVQRLADATLWPHLAGGCHMARDTRAAIEQAGFQIEQCESFTFSPSPLVPALPHILGSARRA